MDPFIVRRIKLIGGARLVTVREAGTGRTRTHSLGAVGDPILPFLGDRAEGDRLVLPDDLRTLVVIEAQTDREPRPGSRYFREKRVPLSALGAIDMPTLGGVEA